MSHSATNQTPRQFLPVTTRWIRGGDGYSVYRGTAEQLIAAGVVKQHHLPGIGNERKHRACFDSDGGLMPKSSRRTDVSVVVEVAGRSCFDVTVYHSRKDDPVFKCFLSKVMEPLDSAEPESSPWPFKGVSPKEWDALPYRVKHNLEVMLAGYVAGTP